jgi:outer membrane autotransporter protein
LEFPFKELTDLIPETASISYPMRTTQLSTAVLLAVATVGIVRADKVLEAGAGQNLISIFQIYSTSTAQPAMLATKGGTILSIDDLVTILPLNGLTGIEADGFGSRITADNIRILGLGLGPGSGAQAINGGLIELNGATITVEGADNYGLILSGNGSAIDVFNSNITSTLGSGALVEDGARLSLVDSNLTALIHGIVATGGTVGAPNSIIMSGGSVSTVVGDAFQVQGGATNIIVNNGATIVGNSSLLRVLDPGTVVNFQASHASLSGDIFADPTSQTRVSLTDSTVLTGKINPFLLGPGVDLSIDGSSQWVLTGSSNLKSLNVRPGANILFSAPFFSLHRTLTVGNLSGTGGIFGMNINLVRQVGDLIDITGTSAGSHQLNFVDLGLRTDLRRNAALLVVETADGVAGFSGVTEGAVFRYYVVHGNGSAATPNPDDWYLVREDQITQDQIERRAGLPVGSVNTPVGVSTVDALTNSANAAIGTYAGGIPLFYADLDTLSQRLGELRLVEAETRLSVDPDGKGIIPSPLPQEPTIGTWVRGFGNGMRINDQVSRVFDQTTGGFQLGADKRFSALNGDLYLGGFLSYANASRDFLDGSVGSSNAISLGAYATWVNPTGWYADLVLKYSQIWNYFNAPENNSGITSADYTIPALGGSLEVGKRFDLGKFFIEPEAQLAGVWLAGKNYSASDGLSVGATDQYSLRGRLGLRAGMHFSFSNGVVLEPYIKVSAVHEFLTGDRVALDQIPFEPTISGTLVDAGVGLAARLNQSVYLYGEYDYANGDKVREPWAVSAGLRWQWGGSAQGPAVLEAPSGKEASGKETKMVQTPPAQPTQPWQITVGGPGWLGSVEGTSGFHGINSNISVGVGQILRNINAIMALQTEVRKGPYSLLGGFIYLNGQAGTSPTDLVKRVGLSLQQFIGQEFLTYRIIDSPHGSLDLLAGFRFTYVGEQLGLNPNVPQIDEASTQLVDRVAQSLTTPGSNLRNLIQQNILNKLTSLGPSSPPIPVAPIAGQEPGKILNLLQQLIQSREPELIAAIRTNAQTRVNQLKSQLAGQVANVLTTQLNRSFSFYDSWFDPVIGLRGRFNLNKAFYLTAEGDIGGFGIGSDIAVEAYAALGCQLSRSLRTEAGFRYYYDDFRDENNRDFFYRMSVYGPQITALIDF